MILRCFVSFSGKCFILKLYSNHIFRAIQITNKLIPKKNLLNINITKIFTDISSYIRIKYYQLPTSWCIPMHFHSKPPRRFLFGASLLLALLLLPVLFLAGKKILTNYRFTRYTDQIFSQDISQNALNLHYTVADPEACGITEYSAGLGSFDTAQVTAGYVTAENRLKKLKSFSYEDLSTQNRLACDVVTLALETDLLPSNNYLLEEMLSPSLGTQAQLPILLAEYTFRREKDVQDYLKLIASVGDYFQGIITFETVKSREGTFMSDATADRVISQCQTFIRNPDSNYLDSIFREKIQELSTLSKEKREAYQTLHSRLIREVVIPAYQALIDGLQELKGTGKQAGGLCSLPGGKEYYEYLVKSNCGLYDSVPAIQQRLLRQLQEDVVESSRLMGEDSSLAQQYASGAWSGSNDPEEILDTLRQKISDDFPEAPSVSWEIKYVHPDLEEYLSPAFYLTPPVDTLSPNAIYINSHSRMEGSQLFTTLAHEGFPGHLYQTVFFASTDPPRIRHLLGMGGYVEGWATYVESYAYGYTGQDDRLSRLQWLNRSLNLCIYSLLDTGIHYDGWSPAKAAGFLEGFGISDPDAMEEIYQVIVEDPTNYLKYYMGCLSFMDLREKCREEQGDAFDLKDFHRKVLETGPCQFPVLEKYVTEG